MAVTKAIDLADLIWRNSSLDESISIPSIIYWLRASIGNLNNLLGTSIIVDSTTLEFSPELTNEQAAIYEKLYEQYFVNLKIKGSLGASGTDATIEISDFGTTVRKINKNEVSKTWLQLRKQLQEELSELLKTYNSNQFTPVGIFGDDYISSEDGYNSPCRTR